MMEPRKKEALLANLAMSGIVALLVALVVLVSILADKSRQASEATLLEKLSSSEQAGPPTRCSDPAFSCLYPLSQGGKKNYATFANIGDRHGAVRVAVFFTSDGKLDAIRVVDSLPEKLPYGQEGWFTEFLGKGKDDFPLLRQDLKKPEIIAGASESFLRTSETLARISSAVLAAEAQGRGK